MTGFRDWPDSVELMDFFGVEPVSMPTRPELPDYEPIRFGVVRDGLELRVDFDELEATVDVELRRDQLESPVLCLEVLGAEVRLQETSKGKFLLIRGGLGLEVEIVAAPDIKICSRMTN